MTSANQLRAAGVDVEALVAELEKAKGEFIKNSISNGITHIDGAIEILNRVKS